MQKKAVNWSEGMKLTKEHFIRTEDYFTEMIRDSVNCRLTSYNYGLLPSYTSESVSSEFEVTRRISNSLEIEVRKCSAITPGGCRIDIRPHDQSGYVRNTFSLDNIQFQQATELNVLLTVCLFERQPEGIPSPYETPPRLPDTGCKYEISLQLPDAISNDKYAVNSLLIGRILKQGDDFIIDKEYIPACTSMNTHSDLNKYYDVFGQYMNNIEVCSGKIIDKINETYNAGNIAVNIRTVCESLLKSIAPIYFGFRNKGREGSPIYMVEIFSSLAHSCYVSILNMPHKDREEMLQYFYEWCDIPPGNFMETLKDMIELLYDHREIRLSMEKTRVLLATLSALWSKLSSLEYIGQHKENIVLSEKAPQPAEPVSKPKWSILD